MFVSFASCLCRAPWFLWEALGQTELVQNATRVFSGYVASDH